MIDISDHSKIERVIGHFLKISEIPRGSGNTRAIAEYLYSFGKGLGLECYKDEFDNVIIKKPATVGKENSPTLILQGHSDIVCEKEADCPTDMEKEGVSVYRDGDFLKARGTTLGADDGVALAYAMAILESKEVEHPALECIFTSDEETGLTGAMNISPELISGRLMINLDSGEEGIFTVGCAGGVRADIALPVKRESNSRECYDISIEGLLGGHSGVEIDKNRANALKILAEALDSLSSVRISKIRGGNADNAIPREAYATVALEGKPNEKALSALVGRLSGEEAGVITVKKADADGSALSEEDSKRVISLIRTVPTGVYKLSCDIEGLVQTSLNVAVTELTDEGFGLTVSIRSSVAKEKEELLSKVTKIAEAHGATVSTRGDYPGWEYRRDSALRETMLSSYRELYGRDAVVVMIHAGLECGIFSDKLPGLDCVSTGPNHYDIHTPKERLSLSSTERTWEFLLCVMKNI